MIPSHKQMVLKRRFFEPSFFMPFSCNHQFNVIKYSTREQVYFTERQIMKDENTYYVLKEKAVPEVLLKVVQAKRLLDSGKCRSVAEATDLVGISRSSFYKYKEDIFPFHENAKGKTINLMIQLEDEPGLLSLILKTVAKSGANILTIHQSIPVSGVASLTLSIEVLKETGDVSKMISGIENVTGVHYVKILSRE